MTSRSRMGAAGASAMGGSGGPGLMVSPVRLSRPTTPGELSAVVGAGSGMPGMLDPVPTPGSIDDLRHRAKAPPPGGIGTSQTPLAQTQDNMAYPRNAMELSVVSAAKREARLKAKEEDAYFSATSKELLKAAEEIERLHAAAAIKRTETLLGSHFGEWDGLIWSCCLQCEKMVFCSADILRQVLPEAAAAAAAAAARTPARRAAPSARSSRR